MFMYKIFQLSFSTSSIRQTKIETTRQMSTDLDLIDFSSFTVFSKWTTAFLTSLCACSTLKSIRSNIVPCSTTNTESSLNKTARSLIVWTSLVISLLLFLYVILNSSSWSASYISDSSLINWSLSFLEIKDSSPCSSVTFR